MAQPIDPIYRKKVYSALKGELGNSFNKTESEFYTSLDNEEGYASKVYSALKGELGNSFNKSEDEFYSLVLEKKNKNENANTTSPSETTPLVSSPQNKVGSSESQKAFSQQRSLDFVNRAERKGQEAGTIIVNAPETPQGNTPTTPTSNTPKAEQESFGSNLFRQLQTGSADLGKMMASVPETLYDIAALPQNIFSKITGVDLTATSDKFKEDYNVENKVLDFYSKEVEALEKQTNTFNEKYDETGIYDNIVKGNYQDAFELMGSGITRSAPISLAMMAGGATIGTGKLAATATPLFVQQNAEQLKEENPEMSEAEVTIKALGMAGAETLFESIGTGTLGKVYKGILLKEGKEESAKIFKSGLVNAYETALKKFGVVASTTGEGIEEAATQVTQNLISGKPATEGVADAFLQGVGGGVVYGSPLTAVKAKEVVSNAITTNKTNKKIDNSEYNSISDAYAFEGNEINQVAFELSSNSRNKKVLEKDLKTKVDNNTITQEDAQRTLKNFETLNSVSTIINGVDISDVEKQKITPLLFEKSLLTEKTEGKDKFLMSKELSRIDEINKEIISIREGEEVAQPKGDFFDLENVKQRDAERNTNETSFNPLETEEEAITRLQQGLEGLEGKERADAIENIAEQHEKSYLDYVATQPNSEEVLNSDFAKDFKQGVVDALNSNKDFKATEETEQDNGSRVDEEGNQIPEVEFLQEQGKIEPIEDEVSPTIELNPVNTRPIVNNTQEENTNTQPQLEENTNQQPQAVSEPKGQTTQVAETTKQPTSERTLSETQAKQNSLVDNRNRYNRFSDAKKRSAEGQGLKQNVIQLASDLGFKVDEKNNRNLSVTTDKGTEAGKIAFKEQIEPSTQADINFAVSEINNGVLFWDGNPLTPRVDLGISRADIKKGEADLLKGKTNTVPAKRLTQALKEAKESGNYEFIEGSGGQINRTQVPLNQARNIEDALTAEELELLNTETDALSNEYEQRFNELDEQTQNEIYGNESNNTSVAESTTKKGESQENVTDKTPRKTKQERIKASNAKVDDIADAIKGFDSIFGIKIKIDDIEGLNKNGVNMVDVIASVVKKALEAGIEIDVAIQKTIEHFKAQLDFDVNVDDIKAKVNEPVNSFLNPNANTGQKEQAFSTRSFNAENISEGTKSKLEALGLNYDVESQALAEANAEKIISEVGIVDAYNMASQGTIRGGARTWIKARMFEELNQQIFDALDKGDSELVDRLTDEQAKIMKDFADEQTLNGQETAMLDRIYKRFDMKYDLDFAKEKWRKQFKSEMPADVEAKLKTQEEKINSFKEQIKKLEETIGTLQEQEAVSNIQQVINRHKNKPSSSSLKTAASALRKAKFTKSLSDLSNLQSDASGLFKAVWDGAIETIATALDAGATIEQSVKKGINEIKKSDWYKNLKPENKRKAERVAKTDFTTFLNEQISVPTESSDVQQGAVKIPSKLIYELVAGGIDNISDLTDAVHQAIESDYPNLTKREVRDAITGYGKQVNETEDVVKQKISKLKTDGKQISALDDLAEGSRPKRSGRKSRKYTPEQRNRIKLIKELLKTLAIDDVVDKARYYQTALENYKTRLENRIKDLDTAIKKDERIINEKRNTPLDDKARELIDKRDALQKEYDEHFGKPYKSDQTLIEEILRRKEKSLRDLEVKLQYAKTQREELPKPERRTVTDPQIDALTEQVEAKREELNEVLDEIGVAEAKRLDRAKKFVEKKIEELREKVKNKDFSKRTPKSYVYDRKLIELKGKLLIEKTKFDLEFEKQRYKDLSIPEKALEKVYEVFGTFKALKATADFSAMLRQGILLGSRNPREFAKATVDMHKFAFDSKEYKGWIDTLESSDDYIFMVEDGLSITDTSGDVLKSEERFVGNLLSSKIMVKGLNVNIVGRVTDASERAYGGMLNSLRVAVYRKLVAQYEAMGVTRQEHPKKYKNLAKFVNNSTGRGSMTTDRRLAKVLNVLFFSPRMITGMVGVVKDTVRNDSTPYLRKQAVTSLMTFVGYQFLMKLLLSQAYSLLVGGFGDDEDKNAEISQDMNLVSTDFNKLKINNTRYDVSSGWGIGARTLARVILNEKSSGIDEENISYDDVYSQTSFGEIPNFFLNKLSPLARQLYNLKIKAHPSEFGKTNADADLGDYMQALFVPLTVEGIMEGNDNGDSKSKIAFDTMLNMYGVGVQSYGKELTREELRAQREADRNDPVKQAKIKKEREDARAGAKIEREKLRKKRLENRNK